MTFDATMTKHHSSVIFLQSQIPRITSNIEKKASKTIQKANLNEHPSIKWAKKRHWTKFSPILTYFEPRWMHGDKKGKN